MLNGNMLCGAMKGHGLARVGPGAVGAALQIPGVYEARQGHRETGRKMKGFVRFEEGLGEDAEAIDRLTTWATTFVGKMPDK